MDWIGINSETTGLGPSGPKAPFRRREARTAPIQPILRCGGSAPIPSEVSRMAGNWIKVRTDLGGDPAVVGMATSLEIPEAHVVGCLHAFWSWADAQLVDGHAPSVTFAFVDRLTRVTGFADAMSKQGWLEHNGPGLTVPKFDDHMGSGAKKRALATTRKGRQRHAESVTKTRPEKRREEKRRPVRSGYTPPHKIRSGIASGVPDDRAEPDLLEDLQSDRAGANRFRQVLVLHLCLAFGLKDGAAGKQKRAFGSVARRVESLADREGIAQELVELAKSKAAAGLDNPMAAWQAEVNKQYPKRRAPAPAG